MRKHKEGSTKRTGKFKERRINEREETALDLLHGLVLHRVRVECKLQQKISCRGINLRPLLQLLFRSLRQQPEHVNHERRDGDKTGHVNHERREEAKQDTSTMRGEVRQDMKRQPGIMI